MTFARKGILSELPRPVATRLWLTMCCCAVGLASKPEASVSAVPRDGTAIAQQNAQAPGQGEAMRGPAVGHSSERNVGDGLCP
jgi:hypothetical protein